MRNNVWFCSFARASNKLGAKSGRDATIPLKLNVNADFEIWKRKENENFSFSKSKSFFTDREVEQLNIFVRRLTWKRSFEDFCSGHHLVREKKKILRSTNDFLRHFLEKLFLRSVCFRQDFPSNKIQQETCRDTRNRWNLIPTTKNSGKTKFFSKTFVFSGRKMFWTFIFVFMHKVHRPFTIDDKEHGFDQL